MLSQFHPFQILTALRLLYLLPYFQSGFFQDVSSPKTKLAHLAVRLQTRIQEVFDSNLSGTTDGDLLQSSSDLRGKFRIVSVLGHGHFLSNDYQAIIHVSSNRSHIILILKGSKINHKYITKFCIHCLSAFYSYCPDLGFTNYDPLSGLDTSKSFIRSAELL